MSNLGLRYYSTELSRWLSRDPIGEYGGMNLYGFVHNNPAVSIDRLGLKDGCCKCIRFDPAEITDFYMYVNGNVDDDYSSDAWLIEKRIRVKVHLEGDDPSKCTCTYRENGFQELTRFIPHVTWYAGVLKAGEWRNGCAGGWQDWPKVGIEDWMRTPGGSLWLIFFNFSQTLTCTSDDGTAISYSYPVNDYWLFSL